MEFWALFAVIALVGYPIHGAVMYGNPWSWIFKEATNGQE